MMPLAYRLLLSLLLCAGDHITGPKPLLQREAFEGVSVGSRSCRETDARYRLSFEGLWSEGAFPKQYPKVRPPAQWSRLIGRSHDESYALWHVGSPASLGLRELAESGTTGELSRTEAQGWNGLLDVFATTQLNSGTAASAVDFTADGNHTRLSAAAKLIPSPDWFVGLDSVDLCPQGRWLNDLSLDLHPHDAGTDQGYTFTSPNWASHPPQNIYQITASHPSHRASSFHYPDRDANPPIAKVTLELLSTGGPRKVEKRVEHRREVERESAEEVRASEEELERLEEQMITAGEPIAPQTPAQLPVQKGPAPRLVLTPPTRKSVTERTAKRSSKPETRRLISSLDQWRRPAEAERKAEERRDCGVSAWSDWTDCSKTCGFGVQQRLRVVKEEALGGGLPCPPLKQEKWCGSMRSCSSQRNVFSWLKKPARRVHRRRHVHRRHHH